MKKQINKSKVYKLGKKIPKFSSYQAEFFEESNTNGEFIFKIYYDDRNIFNLINLSNSKVREGIIQREFELNKILAPKLDCEVVLVEKSVSNKIVPTKALRMRRLSSNDFLSAKLDKGDRISLAYLKNMGDLVSKLHTSNNSPGVKIPTSLANTMLELVNNELLTVIELNEDLEELCNRIKVFLQNFTHSKVIELTFRQTILNEPHCGHGDIKVANVAICSGDVLIMDPAPVKEWQIQDRRVDAIMLKVDLESFGKYDLAKIYWDSYSKNMDDYYKIYYPKLDVKMLELSNKVVDVIGNIYYLVVLLKVALKESNKKRAERLVRNLTKLKLT